MVVVEDELMYHLSFLQPHPNQLALPLLSFGVHLWFLVFFHQERDYREWRAMVQEERLRRQRLIHREDEREKEIVEPR